MSDKKIKIVVILFSFIILASLFVVHIYEAKITPFFQGPDEITHVANSFYGFNNVFGNKVKCGEVSQGMLGTAKALSKLPGKHYNRIILDDIKKLKNINTQEIRSLVDLDKIYIGSAACGYLNVVNKYFYNMLTIPKYLINGSITTFDYLYLLRIGAVLFAFIIYILSLFVIIKGDFVLKKLVNIDTDVLRICFLLSFFMYISMPQNIFMLSVTNQEAYLIPLGVFVFISFFFRIRILTEFLVLTSLYALWFKPVYLPYALLLVLFYVAYYLRSKINLYKSMTFISISVFLGVILAPFILRLVYFKTGLKLLNEKMFFMNNLGHYYAHIGKNFSDFLNQRLLDVGSFFGTFGWLDTPLPRGASWSYKAVFLALLIVLGINLYKYRLEIKEKILRFFKDNQYKRIIVLFLIITTIPMLTSFIIYMIYEVVYIWCLGVFGSSFWSCGIQGRYFLPVYFYTFVFPFIAAFWIPMIFTGRGCRLTKILLLSVSCLLLIAMILNVDLSIKALSSRYYESKDVMALYLSLII